MATEALQRIHEYAASMHHTRVLIEVLALEAIFMLTTTTKKQHWRPWKNRWRWPNPAVSSASTSTLARRWLNYCGTCTTASPMPGMLQTILGAFADAARLDSEPAGNGQLIEPLTERELEILALLGKRYSNKEIAAELVISPVTVKRHAINIYQKLAVHNRHDAVEAAVALGLIPPL